MSGELCLHGRPWRGQLLDAAACSRPLSLLSDVSPDELFISHLLPSAAALAHLSHQTCKQGGVSHDLYAFQSSLRLGDDQFGPNHWIGSWLGNHTNTLYVEGRNIYSSSAASKADRMEQRLGGAM